MDGERDKSINTSIVLRGLKGENAPLDGERDK